MNLYVIYTEVLSTLLWMDQMKHGEGTSCRSAAKGHHIASSRAPMASGGRLWDCEILNRQLRHSYGRTSRCVPVVFPGRISILRGKKNTDSSGQRTKTTSCRSAAKGHHIASSRAPMASGGRLWDCEILNRQLRHSYGRTSRCVPVVFPGRISILRGKKNTDSSGQRTKTHLFKKQRCPS